MSTIQPSYQKRLPTMRMAWWYKLGRVVPMFVYRASSNSSNVRTVPSPCCGADAPGWICVEDELRPDGPMALPCISMDDADGATTPETVAMMPLASLAWPRVEWYKSTLSASSPSQAPRLPVLHLLLQFYEGKLGSLEIGGGVGCFTMHACT